MDDTRFIVIKTAEKSFMIAEKSLKSYSRVAVCTRYCTATDLCTMLNYAAERIEQSQVSMDINRGKRIDEPKKP